MEVLFFMGELYRFLLHLVIGFIATSFYFKLILERKNGFKPVVCAGMYALFMMLTYGFIIEPFRSMLSLVILSSYLLARDKKLQISALLLPFLILPFKRVVLGFIIGPITYLLISPYLGFETMQLFILLPIEVTTFSLIYCKVRIEWVKAALEEKEFRVIIYLSTFLMWIIYGLVHTLGAFHNYTAQIVTITLMAVLIPSGLVTICFIIYSSKKYHEKSKLKRELKQLDEEIIKVENEKLVLEKEILTIEKEKEMINEERLSLRAINHKYNEHISALATMSHCLAARVGHEDKIDEDILVSIKNLKAIASEISEELILEDFNATLEVMDFPREWEYLSTILANFMFSASKHNIVIHVNSQISDWSKIEISQTQLAGLVKNLLSNAIKETIKSNAVIKLIEVRFLEAEFDIFTLEITDHAHEFPIEILQKLGYRSNSTNGTGDGYAEVFELVKMTKASFFINERKIEDFQSKTVAVIFDELDRKIIHSTYRNEALIEKLVHSPVHVFSCRPYS